MGNSQDFFKQLGEPDLMIGGFRLWASDEVYIGESWEFEMGEEFVTVSVYCEAPSSHSQFQTPFSRFVLISILNNFIAQCRQFYECEIEAFAVTLYDPDCLNCPVLNWRMEREGPLGHIRVYMRVDLNIHPMHESENPRECPQTHEMQFLVDQSYLPKVIEDCSALRRKWRKKP